MLKRIVFAVVFVAGVAVAGVSSVSAKTSSTPVKKVDSGTQAPKGFCWPPGTPC
jgi:hypothetical protein